MKESSINQFLGIASMSIVEAMQKIDQNTCGILFVVNDDNKLVGSLTDGDIRRWLIKTGNLHAEISEAMNLKPYSITQSDIDNAYIIMKSNDLFSLPVVNENREVVDIVFNDRKKKKSTRVLAGKLENVPVVMMAGGKGTRLYPYTKILPKPLIPVGELPIAEQIINRFHSYGCKQFYLIVNYKKNMIKGYFNEIEKDYHILYADEDKPLGTGGGLSLLKGRIKDTFILTNCDILIEEDYSKIYKYHKEHHNVITMVCSLKNYKIPYGVVNMGNGGQIESMEEKPTFSFFTNTGCYIVEPEVIEDMPDNMVIGFPDLLEKYKNMGRNVGVYPIGESSWMDMGEMDALEEMRKRLENN